jgi:hypothetical protein
MLSADRDAAVGLCGSPNIFNYSKPSQHPQHPQPWRPILKLELTERSKASRALASAQPQRRLVGHLHCA